MNWFRAPSLQQRIILSVALGLGMVVLVLGYAAQWALRQSADSAFRQRYELAQVLSAHVDHVIDSSLDLLRRTAVLPGIDLEDGDLSREKEVVHETQLLTGAFSTMTLVDTSGNVLWAEPGPTATVGTNLGYHSGVRRVLESGEAAIVELEVAESETPQICLAVPVRSRDGTLAGVLMADLHPENEMVRFISGSRAGDPTVTELVNGEGIVVAATYRLERPSPSLHVDFLPSLKAIGAIAHDGRDGKKHIVGYAPLSVLPGWGIVVERHQDVVLELAVSLPTQILILGILAVTVGVLLALFDVRRVVRPLEMLTADAARMGAGDLDSPITLRGADEVGVLANALESARSKLKDSLEEKQRWSLDLERRVEQRTKEISSLLEAAESLSAILEPNEVWEVIVGQVRRICSAADAALLMSYDGDQDRLIPKASFGCDLEVLGEFELRSGKCSIGEAFKSGRPILVGGDTLRRCKEGTDEEGGQGPARACLAFEAVQSAICVPLATKQEVLGCLAVYTFQDVALTENELRMLQAFAVQAATAIDNARLYEEVQRKEIVRGELLGKLITAQEEERRRIARELHDESAQALTALMMAIEGVEEALPQLSEPQKQRLGRAKLLVSRALGDVRRLIWDLRPTVLDDLGLAPAVRWFAQQHLENADVDFDVRVTGAQKRLPTTVETEVYRILQEAITNVAKHARATRLNISLGQVNGTLLAVVEDDGTGFDAERVGQPGRRPGLGLLGMQERAKLLGGSLAVDSSPGKGTRLTISIPV